MYYFYPNYDIIKKLIKIKTLQIISLHSNFTTFATLIPFILISFAYSLRSFRSFAALIRSIHSARMLPSLCSGSIRSGRWREERVLGRGHFSGMDWANFMNGMSVANVMSKMSDEKIECRERSELSEIFECLGKGVRYWWNERIEHS